MKRLLRANPTCLVVTARCRQHSTASGILRGLARHSQLPVPSVCTNQVGLNSSISMPLSTQSAVTVNTAHHWHPCMLPHRWRKSRVLAQEGCRHHHNVVAGRELPHRQDHILLRVACTRVANLHNAAHRSTSHHIASHHASCINATVSHTLTLGKEGVLNVLAMLGCRCEAATPCVHPVGSCKLHSL